MDCRPTLRDSDVTFLHIKGMKHNPLSRRAFLGTVVLGSAVAAFDIHAAVADEPQKLDVKDPAAVALAYTENAGQVDPKKYPAFVKGANCDNCLQLQGKPGNTYRPCSLFKGKVVAVSGWCSGWTAEM